MMSKHFVSLYRPFIHKLRMPDATRRPVQAFCTGSGMLLKHHDQMRQKRNVVEASRWKQENKTVPVRFRLVRHRHVPSTTKMLTTGSVSSLT